MTPVKRMLLVRLSAFTGLMTAGVTTTALGDGLGWWVALGLRPGFHVPLVVGFLVLGLLSGHLLLNAFLYHPQAVRLRQNLERLEHYMGTGMALRPVQRALLQQRYLALEKATEPFSPPWSFPAEVKVLREAMKQVMVEP